MPPGAPGMRGRRDGRGGRRAVPRVAAEKSSTSATTVGHVHPRQGCTCRASLLRRFAPPAVSHRAASPTVRQTPSCLPALPLCPECSRRPHVPPRLPAPLKGVRKDAPRPPRGCGGRGGKSSDATQLRGKWYGPLPGVRAAHKSYRANRPWPAVFRWRPIAPGCVARNTSHHGSAPTARSVTRTRRPPVPRSARC